MSSAVPVAGGRIVSPSPNRTVSGNDRQQRHTLVAWVAVVTFSCIVAGILLVGRGGMLTLVFPILGAGVGLLLYGSKPALFLGFTWWMWFLTPEIRRIADFQSGWQPVNPLMLAPLLVSGITLFTLIKRTYALRLAGLFAFVPIIVSLFYGAVVGIVTTTPQVALYSLLVWAVPVLLAIHIALTPEHYIAYSATLMKTFGWGAGVMGAYGIVQYFIAPPWDTFWMINSDQLAQGKPYPMEIRVFSTMNSSGPFAFVTSAGMLLLLIGGGRLRLVMTALGGASLMLSLVRAAWLGWVLGFVYLLTCLRGRRRMQAIAFVLVISFALSLTLLTGPVQEVIAKRFDTLTDIEDDGSFQLRQQFYADFLSRSVTNIVGEGIGSTSYVTKLSNFGEISSGFYGDSGLMQVPFVLGWFGTIMYVGGIFGLLRYAFGGRRVPADDLFYSVSKSIVLVILAEMVFENTLISSMGACFFTFLGMCLAGRRHYDSNGRGRSVSWQAGPTR